MGRERIDLTHEFGHRTHRRWRTGAIYTSSERLVAVGQLADGRWWCSETGQPAGAWLCSSEADAQRVAEWAMHRRGGDWTPVDG